MRSMTNESTLALVLAGGNGTRLGDLTRSECKPALPFGGKYRNIDFSLSNCVNSGIRRIAVVRAGARHGVIADSIVSEGCVVSEATVVNSVLGPAVRVEPAATVEWSVLLPDATIGPHCHLHRVIVDSGCHVPAGTVIGRDRELDARRFQVSKAGVVLVTQASLSESARLVA